jgi:hypothetical protein
LTSRRKKNNQQWQRKDIPECLFAAFAVHVCPLIFIFFAGEAGA